MSRVGSTFVIWSSSDNQLKNVWDRWLEQFRPLEYRGNDGDGLIQSDEVSGLILFGQENLEKRLGYQARNKVIYHLGGRRDLDIGSAYMSRAYLGYEDCPAFLTDGKKEGLFRDAFLAGLRHLLRGKSLGIALEKTKQAWESLQTNRRDSDYFLMQLIAHQNLSNLILAGDPLWRPQRPIRLWRVREGTVISDVPRIEVFNFSPIFLNWLNEDPQRLSKLTPEQFEDLVADRLVKIGLEVTKTGNTNTPDGGIDLLAYPKRSSIPFLLAVQVNTRESGPQSPLALCEISEARLLHYPLIWG